jgi:hypothetical protein
MVSIRWKVGCGRVQLLRQDQMLRMFIGVSRKKKKKKKKKRFVGSVSSLRRLWVASWPLAGCDS